jgi:hypothetical protein
MLYVPFTRGASATPSSAGRSSSLQIHSISIGFLPLLRISHSHASLAAFFEFLDRRRAPPLVEMRRIQPPVDRG